MKNKILRVWLCIFYILILGFSSFAFKPDPDQPPFSAYEVDMCKWELAPHSLCSTYFNGSIFVFYRARVNSEVIKCTKFDVNQFGRITKSKEQQDVINPELYGIKGGRAQGRDVDNCSVSCCVYKGKMYVFFDLIDPNNCDRRAICYKTSSNPAKSANPLDGWSETHTIPNNDKIYVKYRTEERLSLTATVIDDKLYLFFAKLNSIGADISCRIFDGQTWKNGEDIKSEGNRIKSIAAISLPSMGVYNDNILVVVQLLASEKDNLSVYDYNKKRRLTSYTIKDLPPNGDDLHVAFGSMGRLYDFLVMSPTYPGNYLWILADQGYYCDLSSGNPDIKPTNGFRFTKGNIMFQSYVPDGKNLKTYITFGGVMPGSLNFTCFTHPSDYFQFVQDENNSSKNHEAWTLLGVIEGIPPFALNGWEPEGMLQFFPASSIGFAREKGISSSYTSTYSDSIAVGVNLIHPACGAGFSSTFANAMSSMYQAQKSLSSRVQFSFSNTMGNGGRLGWLIVEKPVFNISHYKRFAYDRSTYLGELLYTYVKSISLDWIAYTLTNPKEGMEAVRNSGDIDWWLDHKPHSDGVDLFEAQMNPISLGQGATLTSSISESNTYTSLNSTRRDYKFSLNAIFVTGAKEFSTSHDLQNSFSFGTDFTVTGTLLPAEQSKISNPITKITIQPRLLKPRDNSKKPSWVPNCFKDSRPWLLTWEVETIEHQNDMPSVRMSNPNSSSDGPTVVSVQDNGDDMMNNDEGSIRSNAQSSYDSSYGQGKENAIEE